MNQTKYTEVKVNIPESCVEDDTGGDDGVDKVETESSGVLDKGEEETDTVTAGKVTFSPGILLLVLKSNNDFEGRLDAVAPKPLLDSKSDINDVVESRCTLPAAVSTNALALASEKLNSPAFFSVCSNTVEATGRFRRKFDPPDCETVLVSLICGGADSSA